MPHDTSLGREADGQWWFTIREIAAFTGRALQTIYSWERRGHLTQPRRDDRGRRIYSQRQVAAAERRARQNTTAVRRIAG
ncbi:MerR family DNA-binding transcriptional regulator [Streptomyces nigra]|uniref:MerR family DNA-binding transcriptional regulator n=1 Tax=Streptomyces nigra TaxID=1827580 RepID=UPI003641495E